MSANLSPRERLKAAFDAAILHEGAKSLSCRWPWAAGKYHDHQNRLCEWRQQYEREVVNGSTETKNIDATGRYTQGGNGAYHHIVSFPLTTLTNGTTGELVR